MKLDLNLDDMDLGDIGDLTLDELGDISLDEITLSPLEILNIIKNENRDVPIAAYERIISMAQELDIDISDSTKSKLTAGDKIALLSIIVQILLQLLSPSEKIETNPAYNVYNNINTQIQTFSNNLNQKDIETICNELVQTLNEQQY